MIHSHDRSPRYEFDRTRLLHERLNTLFGVQTIPTKRLLVRAVMSSLVRHLRCERHTREEWKRASALALAWPLGQYLGARRAQAGGPPTRLEPGTV